MYVQLNIGRNIDGQPMTDLQWQTFQGECVNALNNLQFAIAAGAPGITFETHESGSGHWSGEDEESVHISTIIQPPVGRRLEGPETAAAFTALNRELRSIAEKHGQEAIALITGSRLIKPRK